MSQEILDKLAARMMELAHLNLRRDGELANVVMAIAPDEGIYPVIIGKFPRAAQPICARILATRLNAKFMVHVSEAWGATETLGKETGLMPSERNDRIECIIVHVRSRDGLESYLCHKFERLEGGEFEFSDWKPFGYSDDKPTRYQSRILDDCFE